MFDRLRPLGLLRGLTRGMLWVGILVTTFVLIAGQSAEAASTDRPPPHAVIGKSVIQLEDGLKDGRFTAVELVKTYLDRIDRIDRHGPRLQSVISLNPDAIEEARRSDARRRAGKARRLEGIPILVKDNIETADDMPTTAGSLALLGNVTGRDAPVVARLRAAGAIILGKTNLSEWAGMRSPRMLPGWSAVGGLTRNPYATDRIACGSSAGSAVAVAASLAAAAIGTETDGSLVCPASMNGVVALKPTVGLLPRTFIIPISAAQDTPGPMGRTVSDVALLLTIMAGTDSRDPATAPSDAKKQDYAKALNATALRGKRIGVIRDYTGFNPGVDKLLKTAIDTLKQSGATIVEVKLPILQSKLGQNEFAATLVEMKAGLNAYLASSPAKISVRSLSGVIAFDQAQADVEMPLWGQGWFEKAALAPGLIDPDYRRARALAFELAGPKGIDAMLSNNELDALIAPTASPAVPADPVDPPNFFVATAELPAVAGDPNLTVPMGEVEGLPVGLSFIGPKWSEARLLAMGFAYERRAHDRRQPTYESSEALPDIAPVLRPHGMP